MRKRLSTTRLMLLVVVVVSILIGVSVVAQAESHRAANDQSVERWSVIDQAEDAGRIEWRCDASSARVRFTDINATARLSVRVGPALFTKAWLQPDGQVDIPLGRQLQRWRVEPIYEAPHRVVVFRVRAARLPCGKPHVAHHLGQRSGSHGGPRNG